MPNSTDTLTMEIENKFIFDKLSVNIQRVINTCRLVIERNTDAGTGAFNTG